MEYMMDLAIPHLFLIISVNNCMNNYLKTKNLGLSKELILLFQAFINKLMNFFANKILKIAVVLLFLQFKQIKK